MSEPLTAAEIIKMIHPDLPPATAHFLLNEAKPLLELIEAQAAELAKYKQLATTAIDDAVALRAKLVPLTAEQISDAIYKADAQHNIEFMTADWSVIFTRLIEQAHNITGEPKSVQYRNADTGVYGPEYMNQSTPMQVVPDGYVLVPVEPTNAMALAALKLSLSDRSVNGVSTYRAMIAAAPKQEQKGGE